MQTQASSSTFDISSGITNARPIALNDNYRKRITAKQTSHHEVARLHRMQIAVSNYQSWNFQVSVVHVQNSIPLRPLQRIGRLQLTAQ